MLVAGSDELPQLGDGFVGEGEIGGNRRPFGEADADAFEDAGDLAGRR